MERGKGQGVADSIELVASVRLTRFGRHLADRPLVTIQLASVEAAGALRLSPAEAPAAR